MKVNIFKYRKYCAKNARNIVLKSFFIALMRYICFIPFMLFIIVSLSLLSIFMFILAKIIRVDITLKDCFKTFSILREAINYFSKDSIESIFHTYYCLFRCKICKKKCCYTADKIDSRTNLPLWAWLDEMPGACYKCYKNKRRTRNV